MIDLFWDEQYYRIKNVTGLTTLLFLSFVKIIPETAYSEQKGAKVPEPAAPAPPAPAM